MRKFSDVMFTIDESFNKPKPEISVYTTFQKVIGVFEVTSLKALTDSKVANLFVLLFLSTTFTSGFIWCGRRSFRSFIAGR